MELYKEILSQILSRNEIQVVIPQLEIDMRSLFELECYRALNNIKNILEDDGNSDAECLMKIEEILYIFDNLGSNIDIRHDFG